VKYMKTLSVLATGVALVTSAHAQGNLVNNGSFELNNSHSGWTLAGGLLNLAGAGSGVQCADGHNAIGLFWQSSIYQDVPTQVGQQYSFSFYMAQLVPDGLNGNVVSLTPIFGSASLRTVSFDGAGKTSQNMGWVKVEYTVTATSDSSRITFFNPGPFIVDSRWPMIDNVWLTQVPEPSLAVLLGLGAVFLVRYQGRTSERLRTSNRPAGPLG